MSRNTTEEFTETIYTNGFEAWWANLANIEGVNVVGNTPISIRDAIETYLPWEPVKAHNHCYISCDAFEDRTITDSWTVYRSDTGTILNGRAGRLYELFTHTQLADLLEGSIDAMPHRCRSVGALFSGKKVFASLTLDDLPEMDIHGQKILPILSAVTTHDGSGAVATYATAVVPQCQNTIDMGMRSGTAMGSVRHTVNMGAAIDRVRENVKSYYGITGSFQTMVQELIETSINDYQFGRIVNSLYPELKETESTPLKVRRRLETRDSIHATYRSPLVLMPGTAWGAWMAISTVQQKAEKKQEKLLNTAFTGDRAQVDLRTLAAIS